ncbi:MAG: gamma-glutamylcyclotransferase family protein [Gemmatimonadota bacterium]
MALRTHFHLFAYGTLRANGGADSLLRDCERIGRGTVGGVLYDIDGEYPALVLYGSRPVAGDIWRCPNELLGSLDAYEGVNDGLFRRVGVAVDGIACWTYVAGPALAHQLTPLNRKHV